MKKTLLSLFALAAFGSIQAQTTLFEQNFDVYTALALQGWDSTNQSSPAGASTWAQGGGTAFPEGGFNGGPTSFALCNFNSTTGAGIISNWLITPSINVKDGDVVTFYTQSGGSFADRLELRVSTAATAVLPTGGSTGLGSFTTLATSVNPTLTASGYPTDWTQVSYTVTGVPTEAPVRMALRYFVTDGGPAGNNSNIIAVDAFKVERPALKTSQFVAEKFSMYPNPATNVLNVNAAADAISKVQVTDINGRVIKTIQAGGVSKLEVNIAELNAGVYMLTLTSDKGTSTSKFVKI